jgi:hypothetical protein
LNIRSKLSHHRIERQVGAVCRRLEQPRTKTL